MRPSGLAETVMKLLRLPIPFSLVASLFLTVASSAADWPQFRGPRASGVAENTTLPTTWNVERGMNVRWQTPIPGMFCATCVCRRY